MPILETIFFIPLALVVVAALIVRFGISRRSFRTYGWTMTGLGLAAGVLLPLAGGVWLPDVLFAPRWTLASLASPSGQTFRVVQYWNRSDFYSTELHIIPAEGPSEIITLDGDDNKSWSVPLEVNEEARMATVTLSEGRTRTVWW